MSAAVPDEARAQPNAVTATANPTAPKPPARAKRFALRMVLLVLVPLIAATGGLYYYLQGGRYVSTDNAYIGAQRVLITPDISGKVLSITVAEGQHLSIGDVLFEIDPEPFRIAVAEAQAHLAQAKIDYDNLRASRESMARQIDLAKQMLALRQADLQRKSNLLGNNAGSKADVDNSALTVAAASTQVAQMQQQQAALTNQLLGNPNLPLPEFPPYIQARAALERAQRDLANTVLKAPISGTATQVTSIQMGRYLTAGTPVFSIVADDKPWIDANPKETDLTYVKAGQDVTVTVDAFPDRVWHGTVAAISPGTGAQFAILPPQNASGNWVKVVQRVPVRIEFAAGEDMRDLRAGMSTTVAIDTKRQRSLAAMLGFGAVAREAQR